MPLGFVMRPDCAMYALAISRDNATPSQELEFVNVLQSLLFSVFRIIGRNDDIIMMSVLFGGLHVLH